MPRKRDSLRRPKPAIKGKGLAIRAKRFEQDITAIANFVEAVSRAKQSVPDLLMTPARGAGK